MGRKMRRLVGVANNEEDVEEEWSQESIANVGNISAELKNTKLKNKLASVFSRAIGFRAAHVLKLAVLGIKRSSLYAHQL